MGDPQDQAEGLRRLAVEVAAAPADGGDPPRGSSTRSGGGQRETGGDVISIQRKWAGGARVIAVTSGKGGVGKSTVVANLAVALAQQGARVLALDGDLGLANLDQILGVVPRFTLQDVIEGRKSVNEVLALGPAGVSLLPGCSGQYELANLGDEQRLGLFGEVDSLEDRFDVLVVDTGAGIGSNAVSFAAGAQDIIIVTTPEPTSIRDAFAMIKVLGTRCRIKTVRLLPNMVTGAAEARSVHEKLQELSARFFDMRVELLGHVVRDPAASDAVRAGQPLVTHYPNSPTSRCLVAAARRLIRERDRESRLGGGIQFFWRKLLRGGE
jgi:flagellar biosynthesis protein FlhG